MKILLAISILFITSVGVAQTNNIYIEGKYFITSKPYKDRLKFTINRYTEINPIEIKGDLWIISYDDYINNKKLIESRIDLYKCIIRKVKKSELIKSEL